jgi:hypothetical protein
VKKNELKKMINESFMELLIERHRKNEEEDQTNDFNKKVYHIVPKRRRRKIKMHT